MNTNIPIEIGKEYEVRHSRKGTFSMRVDSLDGECWITGTVTSGVAKAIMRDNVRYEGETITIRDEHSYFLPINK